MKKVLKICSVAVLALVMVLGMFTAAFAAGSASEIIEFWDGDTKVSTLADVDITDEEAAKLADITAITKVGGVEVTSDNLDLVCKIQGAADGDLFYVFVKGEKWEMVGEGSYTIKDGQFDITFPHLTPVAVYKVTAPKTGDANNMLLWGGLMVAAAAAAVGTVVYSKKRRTEA